MRCGIFKLQKTKSGSFKPWMAVPGKPWPGLSAIVRLRRCEDYKKLMQLNDCRFYDASTMIRPNERHTIGKKYITAIEQENPHTPHHLVRTRRKRKIVSRPEEMISLSIKLWHCLTTAEVFKVYQSRFLSIY